MEITRREILASFSIFCIMIFLGIMIYGRITQLQQEQYAEYDKAARISDTALFRHGMNTNLGNAFVYGRLQALEPVTHPYVEGNYSCLLIIREEYQEHTRTETYRTESGETRMETEIYYSWDETDWDYEISGEFQFLDNNFTADRFDLPDGDYIDTVEASMDVRYVYYGVPEEMEGTLYTVLKDGTISSDSTFYPDKTIQQTVEDFESSIENWFFWIMWIILTVGIIVGFCRMENRWLK